MPNQEIIDKHLKEFHETHGLKVPIELNSYLHKMLNDVRDVNMSRKYLVVNAFKDAQVLCKLGDELRAEQYYHNNYVKKPNKSK